MTPNAANVSDTASTETPVAPRSAIAWILALGLCGLFLYSGAIKALHPGQLQVDIERYRLVSSTVAWLGAAWLPYLEIVVALALLTRRWATAGRLVLAVLLVVFALALASAWARELNVTCGCFGGAATAEPNYPWWIGRDLILLAVVGWLHVVDRGKSLGKAVGHKARPTGRRGVEVGS